MAIRADIKKVTERPLSTTILVDIVDDFTEKTLVENFNVPVPRNNSGKTNDEFIREHINETLNKIQSHMDEAQEVILSDVEKSDLIGTSVSYSEIADMPPTIDEVKRDQAKAFLNTIDFSLGSPNIDDTLKAILTILHINYKE